MTTSLLPGLCRLFHVRLPSIATLCFVATTALAQMPAPLVEMSFSETNGATTANSGSLGGTASLAVSSGFPVFTNYVPIGAFAPSSNATAVNFGTILAGQGGRAIDLSSGTLGSFSAFTVCGWINCRDLNEGFGGNRLAFALVTGDGPGFDLVQTGSGLRLGINQWPDGSGDGGPSSSTGKITADAGVGAANWVFFAVTYDSALANNQVKYYFGKPAVAAALDVERTYARGPVTSSGSLTVGNFGAVVAARTEVGPSGGSRVFRGLIDEVRVFNQALTLAQIQAAQTASAYRPIDPPPVLTQVVPATNSTVRHLTQLEVIFNEPVQGVHATDVLVNGVAATNVAVIAPDEYVFFFAPPATGSVSIAFAAGHGITDFADPVNAFAGGSWNLTFDPNAAYLPPIISEFMADNKDTLNDEDGDASDWIEIYNPDAEAVNLDGWFLTDNATGLTKWRFPAVTLLPNQFLIVFASEKNRTNSAAPLHTNFKLDKAGEYLALVNANTNAVSVFAPTYPSQSRDISFGRDRLLPDFTGYFSTPTPGAPNATSGSGIAPAVEYSHGSGHFTAPFSLALSTPMSTRSFATC